MELPGWFMLRPTSRPTSALGTMTGLEVTKADARLPVVVTTGTTTPEGNTSLAHSGKKKLEPQATALRGGLLTSSQSVFHQLPH